MKRDGRILVLDDEQSWQDILQRILVRAGFHVDVAGTTATALHLLSEGLYHLAILDISMAKGDRINTEGMQLLDQLKVDGLLGAMPVIMISSYGTREQMRNAFVRYKVADFQDKLEFNESEFLDQVQQTFARSVNLDLNVLWEQSDQRHQAVLNLKVLGERVKRDSPWHARMVTELDDLLCRLFYKAESLLVKPLVAGTSGSSVLKVTPFYPSAGAQAVVVKFGDYRKIYQENDNFKEYAQPFIGGGRSTNVINLSRTSHLGGIVYSLLGSVEDKLESFGDFYAHADLTSIKETLTRLFQETCGAWYASPGHLQPCNLTEEYQRQLGLTEENLKQALSHIKSVQGKQKLHFESFSGGLTLTNPIAGSALRQFIKPTYICITHGDLNAGNILVDGSGHAWLIDFERTGRSHILRDIAELDAVIRFQLLKPEEATLEDRFALEQALCSAKHFSEVSQLASSFRTDNPSVAKAHAASTHLRMIARSLVAHNPNDDLDEYYIALLYYSLNALRFLSWTALQRQHALLAAGLLIEQLGVKG